MRRLHRHAEREPSGGRTGRRLSGLALLAALTIGGTALAAEPDRARRAPERRESADRSGARAGGYAEGRGAPAAHAGSAPFRRVLDAAGANDARVLRRVSLELESLSAFRQSGQPGLSMLDDVLADELTDAVRSDLKRATRRAVKDYLLQASMADRWFETIRGRLARTRSSGGVTRSSGLDLDVGFHRLLPELRLGLQTGGGSLRFRLGAEGAVGVNFRSGQRQRNEIRAEYDLEDGFSLLYGLVF